MAAPSNGDRTPEQVRDAIDHLDLDKIGAKAVELYRWRRPRVRAAELLAEAASISLRPHVTTYPLAQANRALVDLKEDRVDGTAVLIS